jgi:Na+-driven multidrug efflux pump
MIITGVAIATMIMAVLTLVAVIIHTLHRDSYMNGLSFSFPRISRQ